MQTIYLFPTVSVHFVVHWWLDFKLDAGSHRVCAESFLTTQAVMSRGFEPKRVTHIASFHSGSVWVAYTLLFITSLFRKDAFYTKLQKDVGLACFLFCYSNEIYLINLLMGGGSNNDCYKDLKVLPPQWHTYSNKATPSPISSYLQTLPLPTGQAYSNHHSLLFSTLLPYTAYHVIVWASLLLATLRMTLIPAACF